jgi:hypothetical protein
VNEAALSDELEGWLRDRELTLGGLNDVLDQRGFALVLMVLMLPAALPLPTGGVTHVLELFGALVALQMIVGRRELWLPRRLARHRLGDTFTGKAAPRLLRFIRWFERHSRPRAARLLTARPVLAIVGVVLLVFVVAAFVAPPFSGLDTLPAMGVVIVSLGVILGDALIAGGGVVVGVVGIVVEIVLGIAAWSLL